MKAVKIAGGVVGGAIVILAGLLAFPGGVVAAAIRDRVEQSTGYRLTVAGRMTVSVMPELGATLTDITLQDPEDRDGTRRLTIAKVRATTTWSSVWSGRPQITTLTLDRPVLHLPLLRERSRDNAPPAVRAAPPRADSPATIDRVEIVDGAVVLSNARDHVEQRVEAIGATARQGVDGKTMVTGAARAGDHPLTFEVNAEAPSRPHAGQPIPVDFKIEMPKTWRAPLTGHADLRWNSGRLAVNNLSGRLDDGAFNGWASIDLVGKPFLKLDLDVQRLAIATSRRPSDSGQPWSTTPIDLRGLNYVDGQAKLSVSALELAGTGLGSAAVEATLESGALKAAVANLGLYDGQARGELVIDASAGVAAYAMHGDLIGASAGPLLQTLADFDKLDGRMRAKLALRATGASEQAIMSSLEGSAFLNLQDGAIRGLNIAQMIRTLTSAPLSGWQHSKELSTDLSQLSASFRIDRGQATTGDLDLVGPLVKVTGGGTIDLGHKTLGLRVAPKLVLTTEGQGRGSDPVGLGIPVAIEGPWSEPRIYPDVAGLLDNPEAAYAKLKQMGAGLFGKDGTRLDELINGIGGVIGHATADAPAQGQASTPQGSVSEGSVSQGSASQPSAPAAPGGDLGAAIGRLIQQGLAQERAGRGRTPPHQDDPSAQATLPPAPDGRSATPDPSGEPADSQPMNDVLRRLFNR